MLDAEIPGLVSYISRGNAVQGSAQATWVPVVSCTLSFTVVTCPLAALALGVHNSHCMDLNATRSLLAAILWLHSIIMRAQDVTTVPIGYV